MAQLLSFISSRVITVKLKCDFNCFVLEEKLYPYCFK